MSNKKKQPRKIDLSTITTIKLLEETKLRIEKLREHKRESYDDILRKILYVLNIVREDPERSKKILERIDDLRCRMFEEEEKQKENLEKELNGEEMPIKEQEKISAEELVKSTPNKPRKMVIQKRVVRRRIVRVRK